MKWIWALLFLCIVAACVHLRASDAQARQRTELWAEAHLAYQAENFRHARAVFQRLADEFPGTDEGREARFYLGALSLDPRNPDWNPEPAAQLLRSYLALDTARAIIHRRPEATTFLRLAERLSSSSSAAASAPTTTPPAPDTLRPAGSRTMPTSADLRHLQAEVDTLRRQLTEREDTIRRQREELERIRRVLTPRTP